MRANTIISGVVVTRDESNPQKCTFITVQMVDVKGINVPAVLNSRVAAMTIEWLEKLRGILHTASRKESMKDGEL